jgi:hypothetical protein
MEESRKRRNFGALMSEHERRVHDKDIKAFIEMDNSQVYSNVPGVKSHEQEL